MSYELEVSTKQVIIDGVDVTNYVTTFSVDIPAFGQRTAAVSFLKELSSFIAVNQGGIIEVYKGTTSTSLKRIFYGIMTSISEDLSGFQIGANDELWKATGQTITKLYDIGDPTDLFGGDIRLIMMDLVNTCGLTMDDSTMDQTSIIVPQVLCDNVKGYTKMEEIANVLYWHLYQDPEDRKIYLKNPGDYPTFGTTFEVGINVVDSPNYNDNIYQTLNEVELQGVRATPSNVENFTGNGSNRVFQLSKSPIATYVKVTLDGVLQAGAVEGSSGTYDYLVNLNKSIITFTTAPTAGAAVQVEYTVYEITSVLVDSAESKSITKGTRKIIVVLQDVLTVDDATQRGQMILEESKNSFSNFTIKALNTGDLTPRYKVNYNDQLKSKTYTGLSIVKIVESWPEITTEVTLGKNTYNLNRLLISVEERVKKLERQSREGILLTINKFFDNNFYFLIDDFEIERETVADGSREMIIKRKYRWNSFSELNNGTYDGNINIINDKIEFI